MIESVGSGFKYLGKNTISAEEDVPNTWGELLGDYNQAIYHISSSGNFVTPTGAGSGIIVTFSRISDLTQLFFDPHNANGVYIRSSRTTDS